MRFKTICRFLVLVQFVSAIFLALPTPQARAATPNAIYISEVAWAGSTLSTSDEWIELGNASASDVSIGGWKLFGAGSSDKVLVLPSDATIPAHGVYLISNYPMDDSHCALTVAPDAVTSTISLSNSALRIELRDVNSNLIDLAGDGQTPLAGYSQTLKANMIRVDIGLSGDDANAWGTANVSQNMYTPDFGTPGIIDFDFADEPVDETPPPIDVDETSATSTPATEPDLDQANTTSTEILSIDEVATSTESILTSTQEMAVATSTATTTAPIIEVPVVQTTPAANNQTGALQNYQYLRLSEVMPYPETGSEWIEITSVTPDRTISLEDVTLYDAAGKFATLHGEVSSTQIFFVYRLTSSRLNNTGDDVYLRGPGGETIDSFHYADTFKGVSWAQDNLGAWRDTTTPTPNATNTITPRNTPVAQTTESSDVKQKTPKVASKTATAAVKATSTKAIATSKTVAKAGTVTTALSTTAATAKKTTAAASTAKPKTTASSSSTSKTKSAITLDYDMLQDDTYGNLRVKLQGSVGSMTGLLTGRSFALLNQDGRGIIVKLPTGKKAPDINTYVEVTGTLKFDTHDLPYISMTTSDTWLAMQKNVSTPKIRNVFWSAPSAEDAWSFVSTTGTVSEVSGSTVKMIVDDEEVNMRIKSGVDYRAARLLKGDTVAVSGLLDTTGEVPAILPRNASEIKLISHAPEKIALNPAAANTSSGLPGWTPFGAALGMIGAIEGVKKVRSRKKIKTVTTTVVREV